MKIYFGNVLKYISTSNWIVYPLPFISISKEKDHSLVIWAGWILWYIEIEVKI